MPEHQDVKRSSLTGLTPVPEWTRRDLALVSLFMLIAAALRIPGLNEGLWLDEIITLVDFVRLPAEQIASDYASRNNHIFYSLLAHFSVEQFGSSAWALRLPAVVFGVCTIPAAYYLGRQLGSRYESLLVAAFLTFSYHHVWFSQDARGYTGLLLGSVLSSIFFVRLLALERPLRGSIISYALIAALSCWIHLLGAVMILAHGLIWLALALPGWRQRNLHLNVFWALVLAGLLTLLLYLPSQLSIVEEFVVVSAVGEPVSGTLRWQTLAWSISELWNGVARAFPGGWPVAMLAWLILLVGMGSWVKQGLVPAAILLLPILLTILIVLGLGDIFFPRFLVASLVFLLLIGVRGGFATCRTILPILNDRQVTSIGMLAALGSALMLPKAWQLKQDFNAAAEFINTHREANDAVICGRNVFTPLHRYLGMDCLTTPEPDLFNRLESEHSRIWFIYTIPDLIVRDSSFVWQKVQNDYTEVERIQGTVAGGDIVILLSPPENP